jgi:hypothetical protein
MDATLYVMGPYVWMLNKLFSCCTDVGALCRTIILMLYCTLALMLLTCVVYFSCSGLFIIVVPLSH